MQLTFVVGWIHPGCEARVDDVIQEQPTDAVFASCFECKATWESAAELERDFLALRGGSDASFIPYCPRCLHDW